MLLVLVSLAHARKPTELSVRVVDTRGEPVPTAEVRFPVENERHSVSHETGVWRGEILYLRDGAELHLVHGMVLDYDVLAPGYRPKTGRHMVGAGRRDRFKVVLEPMDLAPLPDTPEPGRAALETTAQWKALAEHPTWEDEEWWLRLAGARLRTAQYAEAWLAWLQETQTTDPRAEDICYLAARHVAQCDWD